MDIEEEVDNDELEEEEIEVMQQEDKEEVDALLRKREVLGKRKTPYRALETYISQLERAQAARIKEIRELQTNEQRLNNRIDGLTEEANNLTDALHNLQSNAEKENAMVIEVTSQQIVDLERQVGERLREIQDLSTERARLLARISDLERSSRESDALHQQRYTELQAQLTVDRAELQAQIDDKTNELDGYIKAIAALHTTEQNLNGQILEGADREESLQEQIVGLRATIQTLTAEQEELRLLRQQSGEHEAAMEEQLHEQLLLSRETDREKLGIIDELDAVRTQLNEIGLVRDTLTTRINDLEQSLETVNTESEERMASLRSELDAALGGKELIAEQMRVETARLHDNVNTITEERDSLVQQLRDSGTSVVELRTMLERLQERNDVLTHERDAVLADRDILIQHFQTAAAESQEIQARLTASEINLQAASVRVVELQAVMETSSGEMNRLVELASERDIEIDLLRETIGDLDASIEMLLEADRTNSQTIRELNEHNTVQTHAAELEQARLEGELRLVQQELDQLRTTISAETTGFIADSRINAQTLEQRNQNISRLEAEVATLKALVEKSKGKKKKGNGFVDDVFNSDFVQSLQPETREVLGPLVVLGGAFLLLSKIL